MNELGMYCMPMTATVFAVTDKESMLCESMYPRGKLLVGR